MALKGKIIISSIFLRVFSYYILLLLLFSLVLGLTFMNLFDKLNIELRSSELERVGKNAADSIREFVLDGDYEGALSYLGTFNEIESGEIWILSNPDASRPLNNSLETVKPETVKSQKEFADLYEAALKGNREINTFFSNVHESTTLSSGLPIYGRGNEVCGVLIITETMADVDEAKTT